MFGGIGSPRAAFRNLGVDVKSIDYVEIDQKAVMSYNAMFPSKYSPQSVVGWNLRPDILIHGSPCQQISIAGYISPARAPEGFTEGTETESSLMWETIHIIQQMSEWKPRIVIWENVKNVTSKRMKQNFNRYLNEMELLGYTSTHSCLDAREFGIPQARLREFTISCLNGEVFDFNKLKRTTMRPLVDFLETDVSDIYNVSQPSILGVVGHKGVKRATIIKDYAYTITERQDRCPAQIIDIGNGSYRFLTELECWRLMGYSDADFYAAAQVNTNRALYKQAGNSIVVPIFESIFEYILGELIC